MRRRLASSICYLPVQLANIKNKELVSLTASIAPAALALERLSSSTMKDETLAISDRRFCALASSVPVLLSGRMKPGLGNASLTL